MLDAKNEKHDQTRVSRYEHDEQCENLGCMQTIGNN